MSKKTKAAKMPKRKVPFKRQMPFYIMMAPGLILITLLFYCPLPGLLLAFKDFSPKQGILGSPWMDPWYKNFEFFFKSDSARQVTFNTLFYNLLEMVLVTVCAMAIAIALNEVKGKVSSTVYRGAILLPYFLSWIVVQYILFSLLSVDRGIVNNVIGQEIYWYSEPKYWRVILPLAYLWKNIGYYSVLYTAAIAGINTDYYEAAQLDGASKWQQIKAITLPLIKPTCIVLILMWVGKFFNGGFGDWNAFYTLPNNSGALYSATDVIDTYVYRSLRTLGDYGMSTAAGLYQSIVGFILILGSNTIIKKIDPDNALF
ncbi:MAG: ABC transporter permease [Oliverpabstia sp.]